MNRRLWIPTTIAALSLMLSQADAAADHPFQGKWSSDAFVALNKWREARDRATPADKGIFGGVDQGLRGQRGGRGGGGLGGGAVGQRGGRGFLPPGQFGQRGGGGNLGGGQFGGGGGQLGGGNLGGGQLGGAAMGRGGNGGMAQLPAANIPRLELPDGPTISVEFKVDKKNVLTGSVIVAINPDTDEKSKIEEGKVDGKTFKFVTRTKVNNLQIATAWNGEMTTDNTIRATRLRPSGVPEDDEPVPLRRQK